VFGNWVKGFNCGEVYYIPAILRSIATLIVAIDFVKMLTARATRKEQRAISPRGTIAR
jgi:hypothetical protein